MALLLCCSICKVLYLVILHMTCMVINYGGPIHNLALNKVII